MSEYTVPSVDGISWPGIAQVQQLVHQNSVDKGFWDDVDRTDLDVIGNKLMLVVGELIEAHEEIRAGISPTEVYYPTAAPSWMEGDRPLPKPEGFGVELADAMIRIFDLAEALGIDLASRIREKHLYNVTRPYKHNKAF